MPLSSKHRFYYVCEYNICVLPFRNIQICRYGIMFFFSQIQFDYNISTVLDDIFTQMDNTKKY